MTDLAHDRKNELSARQADFGDQLVGHLEPVRSAIALSSARFLWCGLSAFLIALVVLTFGPLRAGILDELLSSPRLALELALGSLAAITSITAGLELGVPGTVARRRLCAVPLVLFAGWTLVVAYDLIGAIVVDGSTTASAMRPHCFVETMLVSIPPAAAALYLVQSRIVFVPGGSGLLAGAAAATLPALWMEMACMSESLHALKFHLSPILVMGAISALLARRLASGRRLVMDSERGFRPIGNPVRMRGTREACDPFCFKCRGSRADRGR